MEIKVSRPASVSIAQTLMIIVSLVLLFLISLLLFTFAPTAKEFWIRAVYVGMLGALLVLIGLFLAAFVGMARRRPYGRWLGVVLLSMLVLYGILGLIGQLSRLRRENHYSISFEPMGGFVMQFIIVGLLVGLLVWLVLALACGKRATSFFSGEDVKAPPEILP